MSRWHAGTAVIAQLRALEDDVSAIACSHVQSMTQFSALEFPRVASV